MRVLCCYTNMRPQTKAALDKYATGYEAEYVGNLEYDLDNDYAYWREVKRRWNGTEDLVIIEHDIEIGQDTLQGFAECPGDWCTYAYPIIDKQTWLAYGLGCARFSARLQRAVTPDIIEKTYKACWCCEPKRMGTFTLIDVLNHGRTVKPVIPGCWRHLDLELATSCVEAGYTCCVHGFVRHHGAGLGDVGPCSLEDMPKMTVMAVRQWDRGMVPVMHE